MLRHRSFPVDFPKSPKIFFSRTPLDDCLSLNDLVLVKLISSSLTIEVVYATIGNPAFCLALYLTGVHFRGEYSLLVTWVSKKSGVDQSKLEI